ncbi:hypothetical protein [Neisseria elongata]|uniref:hypothetical protein n=1 Tax=Neisseria elongata TaxID=495 RepID=UPI0006666355|nr:hypothetical protein [Neisseria elongata]
MGKGKPRCTKSDQPEKQSLLSQIFYEFVGAAIGEIIGYVLFGGLLFMGGVWTLLSISVWALLGLGLMAIPIELWLYQKMKK